MWTLWTGWTVWTVWTDEAAFNDPAWIQGSGLAALAPLAAMFHDPIGQGVLETDVMAGLFGFDPFMSQNLVALRLELAVEGGSFDHVVF